MANDGVENNTVPTGKFFLDAQKMASWLSKICGLVEVYLLNYNCKYHLVTMIVRQSKKHVWNCSSVAFIYLALISPSRSLKDNHLNRLSKLGTKSEDMGLLKDKLPTHSNLWNYSEWTPKCVDEMSFSQSWPKHLPAIGDQSNRWHLWLKEVVLKAENSSELLRKVNIVRYSFLAAFCTQNGQRDEYFQNNRMPSIASNTIKTTIALIPQLRRPSIDRFCFGNRGLLATRSKVLEGRITHLTDDLLRLMAWL